MTKYFTARLNSVDPAKQKRQAVFLEALGTLYNFQIYYGHYLSKPVTCFKCKNTWNRFEEKMTDVNIATELLMDANDDRFDVAMIISGDSDLSPPLRMIKSSFPHKRLVAAFPPDRVSIHLKNFVHGHFIIGEANLRQSQFPDQVKKADGFILKRPQEWMANLPRKS